MLLSSFLTGLSLTYSLLTGINAQSSDDLFSISTDSLPTTTRDSFSSETSSISIPTPTGTEEPCGRIGTVVENWGGRGPVFVPAEVAYECLTSVPLRRSAALATIEAVEKMVQFQSNLAYLKNPPDGYDNPPVDILGGLADIRSRVSESEYPNQYDFEADIASLFSSARDGHLSFDGPTYAGAVRWRRDVDTILVSTSLDGGPAKIYSLADLNYTSTRSPIIQIDGEDAKGFLQKEADRVPFHDPDTRWNSLFYRLPAQSFGFFASPFWYPGSETTLTFENGTERTYTNSAVLRSEITWSLVSDGDTFYAAFVDAPSGRTFRRDDATPKIVPHIPKRLQQIRERSVRDDDDGSADVPLGFPRPYITGPNEVYINGYFIDDPNHPNLAVLSLQTFDTETDADARRYQSLIQRFLAEAKSRGSEKVIIDVSSNGGGRVFLGYDAFLQFFPNIEPFGGQRYRGHEAVDVLGTELSRLSFSQSGFGYTSPFNYHSFLSSEYTPFRSWPDMYSGPIGPNPSDNYTQTLRYNLTDPYVTTSSRYGDGIVLTGTGDRSNYTDPPFLASDLILLSDGICGSTCNLFIEFMTVQAGVKVIVLGGRPQPGPMQPVGATRGSSVLTADYLTTFADYLVSEFATSGAERRRWRDLLPSPFPIQVYEASVNFLDAVREGDEPGAPPMQFGNQTANCRLWYTAEMVSDIEKVWSAVADAAWGGVDGGIDETKCVEGSYRAESLLERPPAPAEVGEGGGGSSNRGVDAADGEARHGAAAAVVVAILGVHYWVLIAVWVSMLGVGLV